MAGLGGRQVDDHEKAVMPHEPRVVVVQSRRRSRRSLLCRRCRRRRPRCVNEAFGRCRREVRSPQRNSAHLEWREVRSRQWSSARMESRREVRSRQRNSACMESERASERASAAAALREVRSHQRHSAHMEGWREVQSRQRSSARVEWREVRSRQWNSARMKWPRNRHAGEPSPARLLKIPRAEVRRRSRPGRSDSVQPTWCAPGSSQRERAASESELARHMPTAQQRSLRPQPTLRRGRRLATVGTAPRFTAT